MKVSFEGIGEIVATFYNGGAKKGAPVKMSSSGEVCSCADGETFAGVAVSVNGDFAAVQIGGYVKMPYSGETPQPGWQHLASDGQGGVKVAQNTGKSYLVLDVDASAGTVGFML